MKEFKRLDACESPNGLLVERFNRVGKVRINDVGSLSKIFGYAGVDGEMLDIRIRNLERVILKMTEFYGDFDEYEGLDDAFRCLSDYRAFLKATENGILKAIGAPMEFDDEDEEDEEGEQDNE